MSSSCSCAPVLATACFLLLALEGGDFNFPFGAGLQGGAGLGLLFGL